MTRVYAKNCTTCAYYEGHELPKETLLCMSCITEFRNYLVNTNQLDKFLDAKDDSLLLEYIKYVELG